MIVETDFLDHWKTQLLRDTLGGDIAVLVVLRIWGHCQQRKAFRFAFTPETIKAITRWPGPAEVLLPALCAAGFLVQEDEGLYYVHQWDVTNAFLVNAWTNGAKGGRPKASTEKSGASEPPAETQRKPSGNQPVPAGATHSKAIDKMDRMNMMEGNGLDGSPEPISSEVFSENSIPVVIARRIRQACPRFFAKITPDDIALGAYAVSVNQQLPLHEWERAVDELAAYFNDPESPAPKSPRRSITTFVTSRYDRWNNSSAPGGASNLQKNEPRGGPREASDAAWNALTARDTRDPDTPPSAAAARLLRARGPAALSSTANPAT